MPSVVGVWPMTPSVRERWDGMRGMRRRKTGSARADARNGKGLGRLVDSRWQSEQEQTERDGICLIISGDAREGG